ncbi:hypothetical protein ACLB2K_025208 [Fragaria x ananassa]
MPPMNFFKLNIDGTKLSPSGKIGAGGVIRNHCGDWIIGFQINLVVGDILDAEAWGLYHGLKLVARLNIMKLEVEYDYAILVQSMNSSNTELHPLGSLLLGCSSLMSKMNVANLTHIFRECNATADSLAKCNISHELNLVCFDNPPAYATQAFLDDLSYVSKARRTGNCFSI